MNIDEAQGRALGHGIISTESMPAFARSLVDGYAVRAKDTQGSKEPNPVFLNQRGRIRIGEEPQTEMNDGACVYMSTDSMMPGKPALFGLIEGKPVFGIPGYPVWTVITFRTFRVPLCEKLMRAKTYTKSLQCVTAYKVPSRIGIEEIVRVNLTGNKGEYFAIPLSRAASVFSSLPNRRDRENT